MSKVDLSKDAEAPVMFRILKFHGFGIKNEKALPIHTLRLAEKLLDCLDLRDNNDVTSVNEENITKWADFAVKLIPLRMPFYRVMKLTTSSNEQGVVCVLRAGLDMLTNSTESSPMSIRQAKPDEIDIAHLVLDALKWASRRQMNCFTQDIDQMPSSARNCAVAYALWRMDQAMTGDQTQMKIIEAIAIAGMILAELYADLGADAGKARSGEYAASERWANAPTTPMREAILKEWQKWQLDRAKYRYPRDFRRAMLNKHPDAVDGTLKNWMSVWGRERKP